MRPCVPSRAGAASQASPSRLGHHLACGMSSGGGGRPFICDLGTDLPRIACIVSCGLWGKCACVCMCVCVCAQLPMHDAYLGVSTQNYLQAWLLLDGEAGWAMWVYSFPGTN